MHSKFSASSESRGGRVYWMRNGKHEKWHRRTRYGTLPTQNLQGELHIDIHIANISFKMLNLKPLNLNLLG